MGIHLIFSIYLGYLGNLYNRCNNGGKIDIILIKKKLLCFLYIDMRDDFFSHRKTNSKKLIKI